MPADVVFSSPLNDASTHTDPNDPANSPTSASASPPLTEVPAPRLSPHDSADFLLHPAELARGRRAAENYLSSFRSEDTRKVAEEALETLATVISGGKCDSLDFPWQQVRPYHGAAALTILKEKGAPARIEALRCRRDSTRNYRMVPEAYPPRQVQKIRSTLTKVIEQCCELGFVSEEEREAQRTAQTESARSASAKKKTSKKAKAKPAAGRNASASGSAKRAAPRVLGTGELRALMASCAARVGAEGTRDAVLFALVYRGLKSAEITALNIDHVRVGKTGDCQIQVQPKGGGRNRRVDLTNEELIYLEDWLDHRGNEPGPLLATIGTNHKVEGKRLTQAALKTICERRSQEAEVADFTPADLTRSAEALVQHRKNARRKSSRNAQAALSVVETLLFEGQADDADAHPDGETVAFPFLGLSL